MLYFLCYRGAVNLCYKEALLLEVGTLFFYVTQMVGVSGIVIKHELGNKYSYFLNEPS